MLFYVIWMLAGLFREGFTYMTGAPADSCGTLSPDHHGARSQPPYSSPYHLRVGSREVMVGERVNVVIEGEKPFLGFLLQAVDANSSALVGNFYSNNRFQILKCGDSSQNVSRNAPECPHLKIIMLLLLIMIHKLFKPMESQL